MLIPTIHFNGNCNEAIAYYKEALGAKINTIAYDEKNASANFVMHSELEIFGTVVSMTDGNEVPVNSESFCFTLFLDTDEEARSVFNKLSEGGKIAEPLAPQFWASLHGYLTDRFGVSWSVNTKHS